MTDMPNIDMYISIIHPIRSDCPLFIDLSTTQTAALSESTSPIFIKTLTYHKYHQIRPVLFIYIHIYV